MNTQTAQSMTASHARKLLEAAGDRMVQVKVHDKSLRSQPGRAVLLSVINDRTLRVKPHHHRHHEDVDIEQVSYWVGGNNHFPEGQEIMKQTLFDPSLNRSHASNEKSSFCVVDVKNHSVWGGNGKGWIKNPNASHDYGTQPDAARALTHLAKSAPSNSELLIYKKDEFLRIAGDWVTAKDPDPSPVVVTNLPKPKIAISSDVMRGIDINAIVSEENSTLEQALKDRRDAAKDAITAKALLDEALNKIEKANEIIRSQIPGLNKEEKEPEISNSGSGKAARGSVRNAIKQVLSNSSKLDADSIVGKIQGMGIQSSKASIKQALYAMANLKLLSKDENGYSLTEAGRK
jgi:hypothetical protein